MKWFRWLELFSLYLIVPLVAIYLLQENQQFLMPTLVIVGIACLYLLLSDKKFKRFRLWHLQGFVGHFKNTLLLFFPSAIVVIFLVHWISPELLFAFPSQQMQFWLITLAIYPIISVIPQEVIFRTFFFHRYKKIIPSKNMRWLLSTSSFALSHLVYGNWIAVAVSAIGGALFGYRYMQTRSTIVVIAEHTLWGSFLFTVGIGLFFLSE